MQFNKDLWLSSRDYIMIILGIAIYSFGFTAFILPEEVVMGGVGGIGSLVFFASQKYLPFEIPNMASTCFFLPLPTKLWENNLCFALFLEQL